MKHKEDLAKIALAALILTSAIPVNGHADREVDGIILAAGCPAHGCPAKSSSPSTQANNRSNRSPTYNQNSRLYNDQPYQIADSDSGVIAEIDEDDLVNEMTPTESVKLTETQLLGMLNPQGRAIYLNLDPEGKALAMQLATQGSYRDKNLAVKEAQRRMNERQNLKR